MKKKLLIFMLVLGMASVSQAVAIDFTIGGATEYVGTPGETITVDLIADLDCSGFELSAVAESLTVNADGQAATVVDMGGSVADKGGGTAIAGGTNITLLAPVGGYQDNYNGVLFDIAAGVATPAQPAGTMIATFDYTIDSLWDGITPYYVAPLVEGTTYEYAPGSYDTAGKSYGALIGGSDVLIGGLHIVPEPMTVLLLGLGGLFLRRRR